MPRRVGGASLAQVLMEAFLAFWAALTPTASSRAIQARTMPPLQNLEAETCGSCADVACSVRYLVSGQVRPLEPLIDRTALAA